MKVNSLYPTIVSEHPEETIAFYKNLGFDVKHDAVTLKGGHVYVLSCDEMELEIVEGRKDGPVALPAGLYGLRMNVSDIDAAYEELKEKGCTVIVPPFETTVGKNMMIRDDQGITISLVQHIKK